MPPSILVIIINDYPTVPSKALNPTIPVAVAAVTWVTLTGRIVPAATEVNCTLEPSDIVTVILPAPPIYKPCACLANALAPGVIVKAPLATKLPKIPLIFISL
jgi:hypothetical protein